MIFDDTIAAVATAIGEGGIGIVRISGPAAVSIAARLFRPQVAQSGEFISHRALYGRVVDPQTGAVVDEALLLVMRAPKSYTREDVVELQCHGGPQPLQQVMLLVLNEGARLAEPGEFTKRAFLNGRLDLSQAEAVIDIIRAKTDASLRVAVQHLNGGLSDKVRSVRQRLLALLASLEAAIDFPEEDIETVAARQVIAELDQVDGEFEELLATANTGRILREGLKTAIIGRPNVGKSSLLNTLVGEERAIVTDIPGTTRDIIEEYINIGGVPLRIIDTAGIRETADVVERIGVERAREAVAGADLILVVLDASAPLALDDKTVLAMLRERPAVVLINKTDLPPAFEPEEVSPLAYGNKVIRISALEGTGLAELKEAIVELTYSGKVAASEGTMVTNTRHIQTLHRARRMLSDARQTAADGLPPDCIVVDLKAAWEVLGEIIGDTAGEDLLDQIFSQFCIGK